MARILQSGFELQNCSTVSNVVIGTEFSSGVCESTATVTIVTTAPRTGASHLRLLRNGTGNKCYGTKPLPYAVSEAYFRIPMRIATIADSSNAVEFLTLVDGSSNHLMFGITSNATGLKIVAYRDPTPTLLGTTSSGLTLGVWNLVEIHVIISNTVGVIEIKINGITTLSLTSQDTQNAGNASFNSIVLGCNEIISGSSQHNYDLYMDDLAINDTSGSTNNSWVGDGGIVLLTPSAAGALTQLSRGGADSGANWSQTEEIPMNGTTDYVYAAGAGSADLYTLSDIAGTYNSASVINCIRWIGHVAEDIAGAGSVARYIRTNSTNYEGSAFGLSVGTSFLEVSEIIAQNPNTSAAWTVANLNALEAGAITR